jgi:glycosyltransferase involved in cell wall biosynthesis
MHICLVNLDYVPFRSSGLAVYGEKLALGLAGLGHRVTVIASLRRGLPAREVQGEIEVYRVPLGRSNWIAFAWHAGRLAQKLRLECDFDIVHFLDAHFAFAYRGRYLASLLQSFRQRATGDRSLPYHSSTANLVGRFLYYHSARLVLERRAVRGASHLLSSSQATAHEFVAHYGVLPERVTVVPLGIDTEFFRPLPRPPARLRRDLGLAAEDRVVLYVGFSTPRKGVETLVRALPFLPSEAKLLVVGKWETGYREKVMRALGPHSDRLLELGYVPDADLPGLYALADVFVFPSLLEGFGLPPVEAMACGCPIVATTVGSLPEVVGEAGLLVPPQEPQALAGAILSLLDDDLLRRDLGEKGRRRAVSSFDQAQMVARTVEVYDAFLSEKMS